MGMVPGAISILLYRGTHSFETSAALRLMKLKDLFQFVDIYVNK